jgi:adenine-specific DNA-methyltransferase
VKTRAEVTPEKLRGGFYTPSTLVQFCLDRIAELMPDGQLRVLEPSAGDGAFIRGLGESRLRGRVADIVAIEPVETEAAKLRHALEDANLRGRVLARSAIPWAVDSTDQFDACVGNPPFVRFQFLGDDDRACLPLLAEAVGVPRLSGVGNLWIPVLLSALSRLRPGGAAAFVIPTECLTGCSAGAMRTWLVENMDWLRLDLFPPDSFPNVLQEVLVLSGIRRDAPARTGTLRISEHGSTRSASESMHSVEATAESWTRYLLTKDQLDALDEARSLPFVQRLGDVATFEVSIVTGANAFFSATSETVAEYELERWAKPLLPRIRHAEGLIFTSEEHAQLQTSDVPAWLLHFDEQSPSPEDYPRATEYVRLGEQLRLPERYKCRIRSPWYRVPHVRGGRLLLSKRSHRYHRLILNESGALTTDTIYRGGMKRGSEALEAAVVAGFHNSLTLLATELEGRSFGGGVLELVPSEIARLVVPCAPSQAKYLSKLDGLCRATADDEALVEKTDRLLASAAIGFPPRLLAQLAEARHALLDRRMSRASKGEPDVPEIDLAA